MALLFGKRSGTLPLGGQMARFLTNPRPFLRVFNVTHCRAACRHRCCLPLAGQLTGFQRCQKTANQRI